MKSGEIYGFVGWIGSMLFYGLLNQFIKILGIYLFWAIIPDKILVKLGINYYPSKQWALIIPSFFCITAVFWIIIYQGLNMFYTLKPESIYNLEDNFSRFEQKQDLQQLNDGLPELFDLPINVSNNALFYQKDLMKQFSVHNEKMS